MRAARRFPELLLDIAPACPAHFPSYCLRRPTLSTLVLFHHRRFLNRKISPSSVSPNQPPRSRQCVPSARPPCVRRASVCPAKRRSNEGKKERCRYDRYFHVVGVHFASATWRQRRNSRNAATNERTNERTNEHQRSRSGVHNSSTVTCTSIPYSVLRLVLGVVLQYNECWYK